MQHRKWFSTTLSHTLAWALAWLSASAALGLLLVRLDIAQRREDFQADARTAHRLLSQRAAQHDAVLATLVLLEPAPAAGQPPAQPLASTSAHPSARLAALYPQVLQVWRRAADGAWPAPALAAAEALSRTAARPMLAGVDVAAGHYDLVLAGRPASFALRIDVARWVPWADWPFARGAAVKAELQHGAQRLPLQAGQVASVWRAGITPGFVFNQALDTPSQAFVLRLQTATGPADWPWMRLATLAAVLAALVATAAALQRQRQRRRRAEQLLRLARTARLSTLGELAAGVAHELNQPLTAVIASTQAARRMLDDDPLPQATLSEALTHARDQARRAADVVARLRRLVERPGSSAAMHAVQTVQTMRLGDAARGALALLQPDLRRLALHPRIDDSGASVAADPVALEQILHNLLNNALQAMDAVPARQRRLQLHIHAESGRGVLRLQDGGPGLTTEVLDHLFEPFVSTRSGGLGLGLSLCATLAGNMGGALSAQNMPGGGAEFRLELPLSTTP